MRFSATFDRTSLPSELRWYSEPSRWAIEGGRLILEPDAKTDYWQRTHYGFSADNGPFLYLPVDSDFTVTTRVRFFPRHQYDQAGLMVRVDPYHWIKTSVEYEGDEPAKLGAVVTNAGYSDWSTQVFPDGVNELALRIARTGDDYIVTYALPAAELGDETALGWSQIRMAHLHNPTDGPVHVGMYACCPTAAGYRAEFAYLQIDT